MWLPRVNQHSLSLPSFAKVNWSLEIPGKRPDGYHEVKTLLQTISLHDDLHFEVSEDRAVSLSCDNPDIPTASDNLIVRAAQALQERCRVEQGIRIRLEKRIPIKAGLGGASSNAAVSLLALSHLWQVKRSAGELWEIAAKLGADVPFFLLGGCVHATGIGTTLSPLANAPETLRQYLIVITPNAGISTAAAYKALDSRALTTKNVNPILSVSQSEANLRHSQLWPLEDSLKNDFESVIFDIEPEIRRTKEALLQAGALGALLAGSGSSVFGIFADEEDQQRAANEIQLEAGWRIFPCVTVSQTEYLRAVGSWDIPFLRSFNSGSDIGA
jgi:4-diphosphocytidyl-2-C-methyl-D-erythritol kinase